MLDSSRDLGSLHFSCDLAYRFCVMRKQISIWFETNCPSLLLTSSPVISFVVFQKRTRFVALPDEIIAWLFRPPEARELITVCSTASMLMASSDSECGQLTRGTINGYRICCKKRFIDSTSALWWNVQKLQEAFVPMEVEVIKSTPFLRRQGDFWACFLDKKGTFTIHSAYNMLVSTKTKLGY